MLTVTGEGDRLLGFRDFNRNFDRAAVVTSAVSLGNDRAEDEARVGGNVTIREFGAQAGGVKKQTKIKHTSETESTICFPIFCSIPPVPTHEVQPGPSYTYGSEWLDEASGDAS